MKTSRSLLVALLVICLLAVPFNAYADTNATAQGIDIRFVIGSTTCTVNGTPIVMDTAPQIYNSRTLLPIRYVATPLGADVAWDGIERKVTVVLDNTTIEMWIDNPLARVNGLNKPIDPKDVNVKPIIINSRTMLPIRFVSQELKCEVGWNDKTRQVTIAKANMSTAPDNQTAFVDPNQNQQQQNQQQNNQQQNNQQQDNQQQDNQQQNNQQQDNQQQNIINNRIINSKIINSRIINNRIINSKIINNRIINNRIINNRIINNRIINSKIINNKIINNKIINSKIINSRIINSRIINNKIINSKIINNRIINSKIINSRIINSKIINSRIINRVSFSKNSNKISAKISSKVNSKVNRLTIMPKKMIIRKAMITLPMDQIRCWAKVTF